MECSNPIKKLCTKKHIIAFIDLLGASEAIKNDNNDTNLNTVNILLHNVINICKSDATNKYSQFEVKAFSDNIVIAQNCSEIPEWEMKELIHSLFSFVALFQIMAFQYGILLRGGITIGELYINNIFVWGRGLLEAYYLECKKAIMPRVLIDDCVYDLMKTNQKSELCHCHIIRDEDNLLFLDFLSFIDIDQLRHYLQESMRTIERMKYLLKIDSKALSKLAWQEKYFRQYISKIDIEIAEASNE